MKQPPMFKRVVIIGLGCIGASIGWAVRLRGLAQEVVGIDLDPTVGEMARQLGALDTFELSLQSARDAHLVLIATPPEAGRQVLRELRLFLSEHSLVTDVSSVM